MSLKRKASDQAEQNGDTPSFFRSESIEDRQSIFIGFYSPTLKPKDLQALAELQTADHKILGWRRESNQQSIGKSKLYVTGSDDDGEKYAGKKIEKVIEASQAMGAVVVARWWGGIMLGPVRFTHIETAARESIRAWEVHRAEAGNKKRRLAEEKEEHGRLSKSLADRDASIEVLRALAAEKEQKLSDAQSEGTANTGEEDTPQQTTAPPSSAPKAAVDYSKIPVDRLRAFDKARDATLSFLLKRIDKAEAGYKQLATQAKTNVKSLPPIEAEAEAQ